MYFEPYEPKVHSKEFDCTIVKRWRFKRKLYRTSNSWKVSCEYCKKELCRREKKSRSAMNGN